MLLDTDVAEAEASDIAATAIPVPPVALAPPPGSPPFAPASFTINLFGLVLYTTGEVQRSLLHILRHSPAETPVFLDMLRRGEIDGKGYFGPNSCLIGTIAALRGVSYRELRHSLGPAYCDPIKYFLLDVGTGDTPATNPRAAMVARWTEAFIAGELA